MKTIASTIVILIVVVGGVFLLTKNDNVSTPQAVEQTNTYGEGSTPAVTNTTPVAPTNEAPIIKEVENKKYMNAILHTSKGDITIQFNDATPNTVANFTKLASEGFYNGTKFHRVIKGFMSQGGDPLSKDDTMMARWGTGGPGYKFNDEITATNKNDVGTIAMANSGPNTNGSQFFINAAANNFLDTKHTVFGKVTAGMDVANAINSVATAPNDRPLEAITITSITLK